MHLSYAPEQERLRSELRSYFAALMTPERRAGARAAATTATARPTGKWSGSSAGTAGWR